MYTQKDENKEIEGKDQLSVKQTLEVNLMKYYLMSFIINSKLFNFSIL